MTTSLTDPGLRGMTVVRSQADAYANRVRSMSAERTERGTARTGRPPSVDGADRQLHADTVDPDVTVLYARAADIPEYVADGAADVGITGLDQVRESDTDDLVELRDLEFGSLSPRSRRARGRRHRIGRRRGGQNRHGVPNIARRYFDRVDVDVDVTEVSGATELIPHVDIADGIVDIASPGPLG
ncbi:ATP phosphoribosyltransferase [Halogeometricum sp. wsp3]|nr:ATP phosphoribosyltransferase [Halogeometricum sp. wsp3]